MKKTDAIIQENERRLRELEKKQKERDIIRAGQSAVILVVMFIIVMVM